MSVWSVLLRLLLSLCLVLNGATAAAAATHLPALPDAMHAASVADDSQVAEAMPCHGHHDATTTMSSHAHATTDVVPAPAPKHSSPDCCKSNTCRCACVHAAPATLPVMQMAALMLDHDRSVRPLSLGHAAPALPHPIRPPIG